MIWTEKYRPTEFQDVIGIDPIIEQKVAGGLSSMNHLLFCGPPGTGKTTTARIIIRKTGAQCLELNASDERGIDVIREKVKVFAMTQAMGDKGKIIFLDEADYLTREAQPSLRNLMETYSSNCKFILTCNYDNKIIPALKSRCDVIFFKKPEKEDIITKLMFIVGQENVQISIQNAIDIVDKFYPDMRKCISKLQELKFNPNKQIGSEGITAREIISALKGGPDPLQAFIKARQIFLDSMSEPEDLLEEIYEFIDKEAPPLVLRKVIFVITDCMKWMPTVANKKILFFDFLLKLQEALK